MTSERKVKANRGNAQASTGPKTVQGKACASRNARRHGLSVSVLMDPTLLAEVENLARQIAGVKAAPEILDQAREIAEAQIDLVRVRQARQYCLAHGLSDPNCVPCGPSRPQNPDRFVRILSNLTGQLVAISRYERRALSRRKFAMRELDLLRR